MSKDILTLILLFSIILSLVKPLGLYIAFIYNGNYLEKSFIILRPFQIVEEWIYKICNINPKSINSSNENFFTSAFERLRVNTRALLSLKFKQISAQTVRSSRPNAEVKECLFSKSMTWQEYAVAVLLVNFIGFLLLYVVQRLQQYLPLNPQQFVAVSPDVAFNTATSFITNTNWQAYSGENTLSYFTQMCALTVQNFLSAATGMAVLMALIRGLRQYETTDLGNFWVDLVRGIIYILIPLSVILSLLLISQGVPQNLKRYQSYQNYQNLQITKSNIPDFSMTTNNIIPMGPIASQIAIKQLGTNGGGYFHANSSHPFENPTPLSNFLEMLAIILIPAALCYTFGVMVNNTKQGWGLLIAMFVILIPYLVMAIIFEQKELNLIDNQVASINMEGKELRFGPLISAVWAILTTATSNGSVNAMLDSFSSLGGLMALWLIDLGEIIFGGVGSGLYQLLNFVIITVFIIGLMVGRTPEYLGKKIEIFEIKMASFIILIMPLMVLVCTAIAVITTVGKSAAINLGAHRFTEILYAFSSMVNNNGSSFAGIQPNSFYNILGGIVMLIGRYWIIIPILAISGSLAKKKITPISKGTLPTDQPLFICLLCSVIIVFGMLTFLPALSLGPIAEYLTMSGH